MTEKTEKVITTPDGLLDDPDSRAFYLLRSEELAISKLEGELPYHKKRESYLCCGRFSPKHKKVIFWPDPINSSRAFKLLVDNMHITPDYQSMVSGATTKINKSVKNDKLDRFESLRKREISNLMERGLVNQDKDDS